MFFLTILSLTTTWPAGILTYVAEVMTDEGVMGTLTQRASIYVGPRSRWESHLELNQKDYKGRQVREWGPAIDKLSMMEEGDSLEWQSYIHQKGLTREQCDLVAQANMAFSQVKCGRLSQDDADQIIEANITKAMALV